MEFALWEAFKSYQSHRGPSFGQYWWYVYKNQRAMQVRSYNAAKRAAEEVPFSHDELVAMSPLVYPGEVWIDYSIVDVEGDKDLARVMWAMLAMGYNASEVKSSLHISNKRYYKIIEAWQTESMFEWLHQDDHNYA